MDKKFVVRRSEAKLCGVAAGVADYANIDPLVVRLAIVAGTLILGPVMVLVYFLTAWLAPSA